MRFTLFNRQGYNHIVNCRQMYSRPVELFERRPTSLFKDEKTQVWRGQMTCPGQESQQIRRYCGVDTVPSTARGT